MDSRHERIHRADQASLELQGADGMTARIDYIAGAAVSFMPPLEVISDGLGRAIRIKQGDKTVDRTFDTAGRLIEEVNGSSSIIVTYDDILGSARLRYPDNPDRSA